MTILNSMAPASVRYSDSIERLGLFPDDLLKLYRLGFLDILPLPQPILMEIQSEYASSYLELAPNSFQEGIYRLALEIIKNNPRQLSTFIAPRLHYFWRNTGDMSEDAIEWQIFQQASRSCKYPPPEGDLKGTLEWDLLPYQNYSGASDPEFQDRPRLLDRIQILSYEDVRDYLDAVDPLLTVRMHDILYRHCFQRESFTSIAKSYNCTQKNISNIYHKTISILRRHRDPSLHELVFGSETIGAICESA